MESLELTLALGLAALLLAVAGYYAWRQVGMMQRLRFDSALSPADRGHFGRQVRRRLTGCVLMVVFAGFLVGWYFVGPDLRPVGPVGGEIGEEDRATIRLFTFYWAAALLVLLALLILAALDLWATARYGFRQHRELEQDRQAMLEAEADRLRRRRQEMN